MYLVYCGKPKSLRHYTLYLILVHIVLMVKLIFWGENYMLVGLFIFATVLQTNRVSLTHLACFLKKTSEHGARNTVMMFNGESGTYFRHKELTRLRPKGRPGPQKRIIIG